ncbi:MAG: chromosome partitioning protein [Candidatus Azotimanducaceae bacterium]|jgi:chromosome partitioning protein
MEVWAVANQKGGVGKTTTTISVADALLNRGNRVLLIDLDPQGSLTSYLQLDPDLVENTSYDLFGDTARIVPKDTGFEDLKIVGASVGLANLEKRSASLQGKGLVLNQWLEQQTDHFDFVLLDTPPALGMLMINALAACDRLLIPVQTEFLALKGLERMIKVLDMMGQSGRFIDYTIIPTMFDKRTNASATTLQVLENTYPSQLWNKVIPTDTKLRESSRLGVPPSFLFANTHGVIAYDALTANLLGEHKVVEPA